MSDAQPDAHAFWELSAEEKRQLPDLLSVTVDNLECSVRVLNGLIKGNDLKTIGDVVKMTRRELMRTPNFGKVSLDELVGVLADLGLALSEPPARDGTLPLPFPSVHQRLTGIEQRLDALERSHRAVVHDLSEMTLRVEIAKMTEVRLDRLERMAGRPLDEFPDA